ncbi:hypothetical protein [Novosphingobium sp. BL-52-GroH]|uniref:hypothetical protein n=1 Tax=Novosphingobium sp. BL-52-GroH TaxID=3349877 RepID=UPI00384BFC50
MQANDEPAMVRASPAVHGFAPEEREMAKADPKGRHGYRVAMAAWNSDRIVFERDVLGIGLPVVDRDERTVGGSVDEVHLSS